MRMRKRCYPVRHELSLFAVVVPLIEPCIVWNPPGRAGFEQLVTDAMTSKTAV